MRHQKTGDVTETVDELLTQYLKTGLQVAVHLATHCAGYSTKLGVDWIHLQSGFGWIGLGWMTVTPFFQLAITAAQLMLFLSNYDL